MSNTYPGNGGVGGGEGGLPDPRPAPENLELRADQDIQGNVLAAFNKDHQAFLLVKIADGASGRAWLTDLLPMLARNDQVAAFNAEFSRKRRASGTDPDDFHATWLNVSLTGAGIGKLAAAALSALDSMPDLDEGVQTWLDGAGAVAGSVGDIGRSDPENWLFGGNPSQVDAIVCLAADRIGHLLSHLDQQRALAAQHGLTIVFEQHGAVLTGPAKGHEHFGFKDGISQPGVGGFDAPSAEDPHEVDGKPGTDLIAPGEFVLGYIGEGVGRPGRKVPLWMWNGSFLVFRRLAQNVPGFWTDITSAAESLTEAQQSGDTGIANAETLGARLVGRWRNGTATDDSPLSDVASPADPGLNDFDFSTDTGGAKTPHAAHIRKVYPRGGAATSQTPTSEDEAEQRRILRRGIPFGAPFDPTAGEGSGVDAARGLVFQCYQTSLPEQFVFLQQRWVNNADFTDTDDGKDAVIGEETTLTLRPNDQQVSISLNRWVTTQGALFGFTPSLSTVAAIAANEPLPAVAP